MPAKRRRAHLYVDQNKYAKERKLSGQPAVSANSEEDSVYEKFKTGTTVTEWG